MGEGLLRSVFRKRALQTMLVALSLGSAAVCAAQPRPASDFPVRPVRWIVPFPAGGSIDLVARILSQKLYETWGQQVVVDNRPGAGGRVGTQIGAEATPDGYNQLLTLNTNLTVDRSLFKSVTYDPEKAFVPVTIVASTSQLLVVNPSLPARSIRELVALCKSRPGQINYGSSGTGGSLHLAMELFKMKAGIDIVHVPYKGGPPAATDLMAGRIGLMFFNTPAALPFVKSGKLRALGVSTAKRSALLPDVPSIAESGVPGFDTSVWYGLVVPAGASPAIVRSTYEAVSKALAMPDVRRSLHDIGAEPVSISPAEFAKRIKAETRSWAQLIRTANIHLN
jgi:tripartite-type tricarboxylate transporter receptor subunit TctC